MTARRRVVERAGAALLIIHHKSKRDWLRTGDSIRGHSSIESALDLALLAERGEASDVVTLRATKSRDAPIDPLLVLWAYERTGTELKSGQFICLGEAPARADRASACERAILDGLQDGMNQSRSINPQSICPSQKAHPRCSPVPRVPPGQATRPSPQPTR